MAEGTVQAGAGLFRSSRFRFPAFFPHPWVSLFGIANADESAVIVEDLHSVISGQRWSP